MHPLQILAIILGVATLAAGWASWKPLKEKKWSAAIIPVLVTLLMAALAALSLTVWGAQRGYERLTAEVSAATLTTTRLDKDRFYARIDFAGGGTQSFELRGDTVYVDARIIKWDPRLTLLGLNTAYQLDRVGGRFTSIEKEQSSPRTIYALGPEHKLDIFVWAERMGDRAPFVDAQYGSATFAPVRAKERYDVRVSGSGLLLREIE